MDWPDDVVTTRQLLLPGKKCIKQYCLFVPELVGSYIKPLMKYYSIMLMCSLHSFQQCGGKSSK